MRALLLLLVACSISPSYATPAFNVSPSGDLLGAPGSLIGWGFSLFNDTNYIEITSAQFCMEPVSFPACTAASQGSFTDYISQFSDIVLGPGEIDSQAFNSSLLTGLGSFAIDLSASNLAMDSGQIILTYNVFDGNPNNPGVNLLLTDLTLSANASVTVDSSTVPEPGTLILVGMALTAFIGARLLDKTSRHV
jgi:hypothetical protein